MIVYHNYLKNYLKTLENLYFLCGDEIALIDESFSSIKKEALKQGYDTNIVFIESSGDLDAFINNAYQNSLFSRKTVEIITMHTIPSNILYALQKLIETPPKELKIIMVCYQLKREKRKLKWFNFLKNNALVIEHPKLTYDFLLQKIMDRMNFLKLNSDKQLAVKIATMSEGNLSASYQELEKISICYESEKITQNNIKIIDKSQYSVFSLIQESIKGNLSQVIKIYPTIVNNVNLVNVLVRLLQTQLQQIMEMAIMLKKNYSFYDIFNKYRVFEINKKPFEMALNRLSDKQWQFILLQLGRIDRSLRGLDSLEYKYELLSLLIIICKRKL